MPEYQDINAKRQTFSKDKLKGELVVNSNDGFYLSGTASGNLIAGLAFEEYLGNEYVFYLNNTQKICRRARLIDKGVILSQASLTDVNVSPTLTQTVSSVTYTPLKILPALSIGKIYFSSSVTDVYMEFNYDFATHIFTFVQLITIAQSGQTVTDYSFLDNGNTLVIYRQNSTNRYYPLSMPYDIATLTTSTTETSSISVASRPYFFNNGNNAYYYSFMIGSGQFDFCVARLNTPYRMETAVKRYGVAFNRAAWSSTFRPANLPFTLNMERSFMTIPANVSTGKSMTHGIFTINGKFNKFLDVTIVT